MVTDAPDEEDRKVIGLFSRGPFSAPPEAPGDAEAIKVDDAAVQMLEDVLERFRAGSYHGCVLIAGVSEKDGGVPYVVHHISDTVLDAEQTFLGGLVTAQHDILRIVDEAYFDDED